MGKNKAANSASKFAEKLVKNIKPERTVSKVAAETPAVSSKEPPQDKFCNKAEYHEHYGSDWTEDSRDVEPLSKTTLAKIAKWQKAAAKRCAQIRAAKRGTETTWSEPD